MPPRPRPLPKKGAAHIAAASTAPPQNVTTSANANAMMPPPTAVRLVPTAPLGLLEPEIVALSACLKNAAVKTGQVYQFYADAARLGIADHATKPPRSLTASLGREIEKYDQLCDALESNLLRAISVLQRDVGREEQRILASQTASIATRTRSKSTSLSPVATRIPLPPVPSEETTPGVTSTPIQPPASSPHSTHSGRRQSVVSLSSLHRPVFPLKLDLSSSAMRISAEEAAHLQGGRPGNGMASPVTLAPKSARPVPMSSDLLFQQAVAGPSNLAEQQGGSADKPIELDLESMGMDMSDLFGDAPDSAVGGTGGDTGGDEDTDNLFTPAGDAPLGSQPFGGVKQEDVDSMAMLDALTEEHDLFASLDDGSAAAGGSSNAGEGGEGSTTAGTENAPFELDALDLDTLGPEFFSQTGGGGDNAEQTAQTMDEMMQGMDAADMSLIFNDADFGAAPAGRASGEFPDFSETFGDVIPPSGDVEMVDGLGLGVEDKGNSV